MHSKPAPNAIRRTCFSKPDGGHSKDRKLSGLALAVWLACQLGATDASALALGRSTVFSALGEPLRVEVDLPGVTAEEINTLQVGIASPEAFRSAGLEFNPLLTDVRVLVEQRADGRTVLRLTSNRSVNEPFVDVMLQAGWAGGQLLRGYTMLFDPPSLKAAATPVLPAANASAKPAAPSTAQQPAAPLAVTNTPTASSRIERAPAARQDKSTPSSQASDRRVTVRRGDTAAQIARDHLGGAASLDQMLVAMLRANPDAFVGQNVNRLKAGAVLDIPSDATAADIAGGEARQVISGQSRDFNEYRQRLARTVPHAQTQPDDASKGRMASGKVESAITEQRPASKAPDKLSLTKGKVEAKGSAEDKLAEQRASQARTDRSSELQRNVEELNKLSQAASAVQAPPQAPAASPASTPAPATGATAVTTPASAASASAPAANAPANNASGLWQELLANPLLPAAGAGVAVLLGAWAWLRRRKPASKSTYDSFLDSREHQESSFDASGGQTVDTSEQAGPVSSMMYSPSQLDAAGDVDPVAEADVYLAYGRDQQAEEILRDALRVHPDRLPLHQKLLEIHSQRHDKAGFEQSASEVYALTQGQGPAWDQTCSMGLELDPANALYQSVSSPMPLPPAEAGVPSSTAGLDLDLDLGGGASDVKAAAYLSQTAPDAMPTPDEVHIDLDFPSVSDSEPASLETAPTQAAAEDHLEFDLDLTAPLEEALSSDPAAEHGPEPAPTLQEASNKDMGLDFDLDLSNLGDSPEAAAVAEAPTPAAHAALDFDLDLSELEAPASPTAPMEPMGLPPEIQGLSLDLGTPAQPTSQDDLPDLGDLSDLEVTEASTGDDPHETKLALAKEFQAIGDVEGARALAEEVEAEASGELKTQAKAFLAQLD